MLFLILLMTGMSNAHGQSDRPESNPIPPVTEVTGAMPSGAGGRRIDVGGGNLDANELDEVPWQSLKPGDTVNIFHREEPYRHKILLSERGTADAPIVINGVSSDSGDRPTIHAANASSVNPDEWDPDYAGSVILLHRQFKSGRYGENAEHYRVQNLRITGVRSANHYQHGDLRKPYAVSDRAIWSAGGQFVTLQGMVIEDNNAGLFVQSADDPGALSRAWIIRGNRFSNNGYGNRHHQIYLQAVSMPGEYNLVEGNYFGPPTPGQDSVAQLKTRSTGTIVRYNWFNSAHRTLDIVEAQDAIPDWMYRHYTPSEILDEYRTSYVYGNVFVADQLADDGQPASRPIHIGADSLDSDTSWGKRNGAAPEGESGMRGYGAATHFYSNTFYLRASSDAFWRGSVFDLDNNNSRLTPNAGVLDAWNNIFVLDGDFRVGLLNRTGTLRFNGGNLIDTGNIRLLAESDGYARDENRGNDPNVHIENLDSAIMDDALLVDSGHTDLGRKNLQPRPDSPAIGAGKPLPEHLSDFLPLYQPAGHNGGTIVRPGYDDLGAFQHIGQ